MSVKHYLLKNERTRKQTIAPTGQQPFAARLRFKQKLGISGVQSDICGWKGDGAQIDLLIDRRDQTINLCEMKFSQGEFEITKQYDERLRDRAEIFRSATKTRKAIHQTFVTTYGLKKNIYSGNVQSEVVLDDLFAE